MEMSELQHPDSIWTWKSAKTGKASLWLPYFDRVEPVRSAGKDIYRFVHKGGEVIVNLKKIETIMLYGASGSLPIAFLDHLNRYRIPLMIHRRNMESPYLFFPDVGSDPRDVLSRQISVRNNQTKRVYVARTLIRSRLNTLRDRIPISQADLNRFNKLRDVDSVRAMEAKLTARYWKCYYESFDMDGNTARRDRSHPVNKALNASSYFMSGILLRWVLFHKLSPQHGYMHLPTNYPALIYDLIEPYRYIFENAVASSVRQGGLVESESLTAMSIGALKRSLEEPVYVPVTRQTVRRKNLLHGAVLALRAYLVGDMKRLVIPIEGERHGGRPVKVSYSMPGGIR